MASVEFTGFDNLRNRLQALIDGKTDALKAAGTALLVALQKEFIDGGNGWPAWSKAYANRIARHGPAHQMLWLTGTLLRSLALGGDGNVFELDGDTLTIGSNVKYAKRQNEGGGGIPARKFMFVDEQRLELAQQAFVAQLKRSMNA